MVGKSIIINNVSEFLRNCVCRRREVGYVQSRLVIFALYLNAYFNVVLKLNSEYKRKL